MACQTPALLPHDFACHHRQIGDIFSELSDLPGAKVDSLCHSTEDNRLFSHMHC